LKEQERDRKTIDPADQSDLDILRRFSIHNDPQAFAEIVRRHAAFVYATCLRVLGSPARAEDASQETFFRLMQRPHDINQSLGAWLHRTATHVSVDALRSDSSRRRREISYSETVDREASSWSELSPAVDQALSELPEEIRVLMVQHFLMGRAQSDLAHETGQSAATISRRIHQGLDELRHRLRLKGIYALPAALAGLLCHASARQAPASLVHELGKMTMYSASSSPKPALHLNSPGIASLHARILLAIVCVIGVLMMLEMTMGNWPHHWPTTTPPTEIQSVR
jgi:RNA polymerase sigma-70 factor (ECF subfamily)